MANLSNEIIKLLVCVANEEGICDYKIDAQEREFSGDNYLGIIYKVTLIGKYNGSPKKLQLIVKKAPENLEARSCMSVKVYYNTELFIYENVIPAFAKLQNKYDIVECERFTFPKYYGGSVEHLKEIVILEDLSYDGYEMYERRIPLDYNHFVLVIDELAKLHSLSFIMKYEKPELFKLLSQKVANTENYGDFIVNITNSCIDKIMEKVKDERHLNKLMDIRKNVYEVYSDCLDASKTEPYNVICHGDVFRNNFLFKYENGRVKSLTLIDWQMSRYASPVSDITYAVCLSTDHDLRSKHLLSMLDMYYERLGLYIKRMGGDVQMCYPRIIFDKHVSDIFHFGLVFAMMSIPHALKKPGEEKCVEEISDDLKSGNVDVVIHDNVLERIEGLLDDFISFDSIS